MACFPPHAPTCTGSPHSPPLYWNNWLQAPGETDMNYCFLHALVGLVICSWFSSSLVIDTWFGDWEVIWVTNEAFSEEQILTQQSHSLTLLTLNIRSLIYWHRELGALCPLFTYDGPVGPDQERGLLWPLMFCWTWVAIKVTARHRTHLLLLKI